MKNYFYVIENGRPVAVTVEVWRKWFEEADRVVAKDNIGKVTVSTVFVGINNDPNSSLPVLWETMIFGGPQDGYHDTYTTLEDAIEGHSKAIELVKACS